jgi:hypothetical protein
MTDDRALELIAIAREMCDKGEFAEFDGVAEGEETEFVATYLFILMDEGEDDEQPSR